MNELPALQNVGHNYTQKMKDTRLLQQCWTIYESSGMFHRVHR